MAYSADFLIKTLAAALLDEHSTLSRMVGYYAIPEGSRYHPWRDCGVCALLITLGPDPFEKEEHELQEDRR